MHPLDSLRRGGGGEIVSVLAPVQKGDMDSTVDPPKLMIPELSVLGVISLGRKRLLLGQKTNPERLSLCTTMTRFLSQINFFVTKNWWKK